jgi:hypothetical protein
MARAMCLHLLPHMDRDEAMLMDYCLEVVQVVVDNTAAAAAAHIQHIPDTEVVVEMDSCWHMMRVSDHMRETWLVVGYIAVTGCIAVAGTGFVCDVEPYHRPQSLLLVLRVYGPAADEISFCGEGDRRLQGLLPQ